MSLVGAILKVFGGGPKFTPDPTRDFQSAPIKQGASSEDRSDLLVEPAKGAVDAVPEILAMQYVDAGGTTSQRYITLRKVWSDGATRYLQGHCHLRNALRTFRVDRIRSLHDPATGELYEPPGRLLDQFLDEHPDETMALIGEHRAQLAVLVYLARCDAAFDVIEHKVILSWLKRRARGRNVSWREVGDHVRRIYPSYEDVESALPMVASMPTRSLKSFFNVVAQVVVADGRAAENELAFLSRLSEAMKPYGVHVAFLPEQNQPSNPTIQG